MAKFCGNCGAQLDDNARVCGKCGTPLSGTPSSVSNVKIIDPEKKKAMQKKIMKTAKLCVAVAALVLAVVIVFNVITMFTGYNGLLRKVMIAFEDYDIDTLVEMSSDMYYYGDENYAEYYFEYNVGNALDLYEAAVGHNYKLSYEVIESYSLSNRKLEEALDSIAWKYSEFDTNIIEEIVVADITVTVKQGNKSVDKSLKVTMSKEDGTWKLLYIE